MGDATSLKDLAGISEPATKLIEKVSDAVGGLAAPWQIRRVAEAEADAEQIRALGQVRSDFTLRALDRFLKEETKKQQNMETIGTAALAYLAPDSDPERMDDDWIVNFFDKCRLISDSEMQQLWAKVLAGEANTPGRYSKRTVNYLSSLDKEDAHLFTSLCSYGWVIGDVIPLIFDEKDAIYNDQGITFSALMHLDEIGLISFGHVGGYKRIHLPQKVIAHYYGQPFLFEFANPEDNQLETGKVLLSKAGQELAPICPCEPVPGFKEYAAQKWTEKGVKVSEVMSKAE